MKKTFICLCLLALLALGSLAAIHQALSDTGSAVEITETAHLGDPKAAQGLELTIKTQDLEALFWNTSMIPGQAPETDFTVDLDYNYFDYHSDGPDATIAIGQPLNFGVQYSSLGVDRIDEEGLLVSDILNDVAQRTKPGSTHTEVLHLRDYVDFYPFSLNFYSKAMHGDLRNLEHRLHSDDLTPEQQAEYQEQFRLMTLLTEAFRFPLPERDFITVQISKNADGAIFDANCAEGTSDVPPADTPFTPESDEAAAAMAMPDRVLVHVQCPSLFSQNAVYFVPEFRTPDGELLDYRLTPGGYGLYRLPLDDNSLPIPEELTCVMPLRPEEHLEQLLLDEDANRILLATSVDTEVTLRLADTSDGHLVQSLPAGRQDRSSSKNPSYVNFLFEKNVLMVIQFDRSFQVLTQEENGDFVLRFTGDLSFLENFPMHYLYQYSLAYDQGRLALLCNERFYAQDTQCAFSLMVWDETGLLYAGNYQHSLDRSRLENGYQSIVTDRDSPLEVRFS